jgi:radical SAM superfamily enzyme YgiQ (UPF0313 family)
MARTLEQILPEVEKPARYLGGERNSVVKDHGSVRMKALLAFPDVYEIGMSHLGLRILYSVLNKRDDMLLERCFTPWTDMEQALRESGHPLTSLETHTPLAMFDVVGFSLQYELGFTNVLTMLDLAGIPLRSADRDERHPLVIAGGPVVFSPEPVADFFDLFLIGDGEEAFPRVMEEYDRLRAAAGIMGRGAGTLAAVTEGGRPSLRPGDLPSNGGAPGRRRGDQGREGAPAGEGGGEAPAGSRLAATRLRILKELAHLPGVYVPSLYRTEVDAASGLHYVAGPDTSLFEEGERLPPFPIRRATLEDLNKFPFPAATVVPHSEIVHDRVSIELARGCTEGCRFCQAGTIYRPVRERSTESIIDSALDGLEKTGYDEVSLTSLSPADYSCLPDLVGKMMDRMADARVGLSVSSLRPYGLTEELAKQIGRVKKSGFTIAPEAGTQRMRDVLNKGITEEHILQAAYNAFGQGWDLIKTYFMIGLPVETDEDLVGMIDLCEKIDAIGRERLSKKNGGPGGAPRIHFSASSHVPKPHAPFQWARMLSTDELYAKQRFLAARLRNPRVKFKRHHVETSILECVMSRGDRRLCDVIERAYRKGCRFDGWTELFRWESWKEAFEESGLAMDPFLAEIPLEASLPWDHIDTTVLKAFLVREWNRALKGKLSPPCEKPHKKFNRPFRRDDKLICYDCGCACDLPHIVEERVANHEKLLSITSTRAPLAAAPVEAPVIKYRATFRKAGRARFLSHLDLNRAFGRAFRRAGVRLKYTQGFNPKPNLAFTPALALGAEGHREAVDFQLGRLEREQDLIEGLNRALPEGIEVQSVALLQPGDPSLTADVTAARYRVTLPVAVTVAPLTPGRKGSGSVDAMPFNEESGLRAEEEPGDGGRDSGDSRHRKGRKGSGARRRGEGARRPERGDAGRGGQPRGRPESDQGGSVVPGLEDLPAADQPSARGAEAGMAPAGATVQWHRARIDEFNGSPSRVIDKTRKGRLVKVDLKEFTGRVTLDDVSGPDGVTLSFRIEFHTGATVRPEEVLAGIYGFVPRDCTIVREELQFGAPPARPVVGPHAAPAAPVAG